MTPAFAQLTSAHFLEVTAYFAVFILPLTWLTLAVVHISFAIAILADASDTLRRGEKMVFVPGILWALTALATGVIGAGFYWIMHKSTLAQVQSNAVSAIAADLHRDAETQS